MVVSLLLLTEMVVTVLGQNGAWRCDGVLTANGSSWCELKARIPCHDLSCQIPPSEAPSTECPIGATPTQCAYHAAPLCAAAKECVAFGVLQVSVSHPPWIEWYNATATNDPLPDTDWIYYFNASKLGYPDDICRPGPSRCPPAPSDSIFPPPGDYPPGCNHKGCSTVPQNLLPKWAVTYQMNQSTIIMPCNGSGPTDPNSTRGWAFVDFDWSNWKGIGNADGWAKHKPMDCEELMVKQTEMTVAASPGTKIFVYRNMIKALPWFTSVREKLTSTAYESWFMKFRPEIIFNHSLSHVPVCDENYNPPLCTNLYHDQSQTPGYPHGDGDCSAPACDVGSVPVGEYLFDPRSANVSVNGQTFIEWFVDEYFGGPAGIGNPDIIGFYIDDDWGNMNPNGPSEMEGHAMVDMGFGPDDLKEIVSAYNWVANTVYHSIVEKGKFAWDLFLNNDPNCINCGDCPQPWVKKSTCAADLRAYGVNKTSPFVSRALLYGFSPGSCHGVNPTNLTEVEEDIANFLLVRGPYAYLGNGWTGCSHGYEYPAELFNADYGVPLGRAQETSPNSEVFVREWSKATIQMDCNTYTPSIKMK